MNRPNRTQARAACAFCGDSSQTLTREHVLPEHWEREFPPERHKAFRQSGIFGVKDRARSTTRYDERVKDFCHDCNHGWMNDLDMSIKPMMLELAWGRTTTIPATEGELFRTWATKIALVRTRLDAGGYQAADPLRFKEFFERRRPFGQDSVQVGASEGVVTAGSSTSTMRIFMSGGVPISGHATSNVVTYTIGKVFFLVGIFGPETRQDVMASLAAVRKYLPQKGSVLRPSSGVTFGEPITGAELQVACEPKYLRGLKPLTGTAASD
jgi:hypothetical protein